MKLFGLDIRLAGSDREQRAQTITQNANAEELMAFFGLSDPKLPYVNTITAMKVPAVLAAVTFLSRTLATLSLDAFRDSDQGPQKIRGGLQTLIHDAPSQSWTSFDLRSYFWRQVFTHGRGLIYISRSNNGQPAELWPINASATRVSMGADGRRLYTVSFNTGQHPGGAVTQTYAEADVIDVPFMLKDDQCGSFSPITLGAKAIQLALAMNDYGSTFFSGGGVPPLALTGPLPQGNDAMRRAMADMARAIDVARKSTVGVFPIPSGHELKPVGFDPAKGQMTEARLFQIQEIARVYQLPPIFLQELSRGTFSNTEQQDLHVTKHLISQWASALEQQMNLKLFGQMNGRRFIRHDIDSLMRGDFLSRMEGLAKSIQNALLTPNEGRAREGLAALANGDELLIQGATVPLGTQPAATAASANGVAQ